MSRQLVYVDSKTEEIVLCAKMVLLPGSRVRLIPKDKNRNGTIDARVTEVRIARDRKSITQITVKLFLAGRELDTPFPLIPVKDNFWTMDGKHYLIKVVD